VTGFAGRPNPSESLLVSCTQRRDRANDTGREQHLLLAAVPRMKEPSVVPTKLNILCSTILDVGRLTGPIGTLPYLPG
jgi:hypothetical protein